MSAERILPVRPAALSPTGFTGPARACVICRAAVNPLRPFCLRHWRMVPAAVKIRVGEARRAHSRGKYLHALVDAVAAVRAMEGGGGT